MKYSPQLDGLRAIAILAVFVYHVRPALVLGGFTGVDVFFVLSGYLIASVILHDVRARRFSMREFYLRRIQRLLPNAVLTVLATVVLAALVLRPSAAVRVAQHGLWTVVNLSNFYLRKRVGGYWGDTAGSIPLLHTWSLAVEEQFYVVFPATLLFLSRRSRATWLMVGIAVTSFALCVWTTWTHPLTAFYMLPPRAWELLLGAVLAMRRVPVSEAVPLPAIRHSRTSEVVGWAGVALMMAAFVVTREAQGFPGFVALLPTVGALAVIATTSEGEGRLARVLGHPFMVTVGKWSYSLYLWHWPLIVLGREYARASGRPEFTGALAGAAASVVTAALVYRFVEVPLRGRGRGRGLRLATIAGAFAASLLACVALSHRAVSTGVGTLFARETFQEQRYDCTGVRSAPLDTVGRFAGVTCAPADSFVPNVWRQGGIVHRWGPGDPEVVVLGSSHALMYAAMVDGICRARGVSVAFLAVDGASVFTPNLLSERCPSLPDAAMTRDFVQSRRRWIRTWRPRALLVVDRWDRYQPDPATVERGLRELVGEFGPIVGRVLVPTQVPVLAIGEDENPREWASWYHHNTGRFPAIAPDAEQAYRDSSASRLARAARDLPNVRVIDLAAIFREPDGSVRYREGRDFFYLDDDHLTDGGTAHASATFSAAIDSALAVR